jgi:hypothetical protein
MLNAGRILPITAQARDDGGGAGLGHDVIGPRALDDAGPWRYHLALMQAMLLSLGLDQQHVAVNEPRRAASLMAGHAVPQSAA